MHPYVWCVVFLLLLMLLYPQAAFMDLPLINILRRLSPLYGGIPHASWDSGDWIKIALETFLIL